MKITNSIRVTKCGKARIKQLLGSPLVNDYHKSLIKSIEQRIPKKNVSKSDTEMLNLISEQYGGNKC